LREFSFERRPVDDIDFGRNKGFLEPIEGNENFRCWKNPDFQMKKKFLLLKFIFPGGILNVN